MDTMLPGGQRNLSSSFCLTTVKGRSYNPQFIRSLPYPFVLPQRVVPPLSNENFTVNTTILYMFRVGLCHLHAFLRVCSHNLCIMVQSSIMCLDSRAFKRKTELCLKAFILGKTNLYPSTLADKKFYNIYIYLAFGLPVFPGFMIYYILIIFFVVQRRRGERQRISDS